VPGYNFNLGPRFRIACIPIVPYGVGNKLTSSHMAEYIQLHRARESRVVITRYLSPVRRITST
jgi:hypothetical protein